MSWGTFQTPYSDTQSYANNARAQAQRSGAGFSFAGQGLGRGAGQRSADTYRSDVARAAGQGAANTARDEDAFANQNAAMTARLGSRNERLQYDSLAEQFRQAKWDSRFNNMNTAWGALAGLLR